MVQRINQSNDLECAFVCTLYLSAALGQPLVLASAAIQCREGQDKSSSSSSSPPSPPPPHPPPSSHPPPSAQSHSHTSPLLPSSPSSPPPPQPHQPPQPNPTTAPSLPPPHLAPYHPSFPFSFPFLLRRFLCNPFHRQNGHSSSR